MDGYGGFERFLLLGLLVIVFQIFTYGTKGVVLDMTLMSSIVLAILTITIVYVFKGIYINKFNFEGSLKGFKLSFETKKEKDAPSCKKQRLNYIIFHPIALKQNKRLILEVLSS